jgi:hypothetical protein
MRGTTSRRVLGAAAMGAVLLAAGGRAEAAPASWRVLFCGGPIWCDPIQGSLASPAGPVEVAVPVSPVPGARYIPVHEFKSQAIRSSLGMGHDGEGQPLFSRFDGKGIPAGETVRYLVSKSLGAVTRDAVNGGMAHGTRIDDPALNGRPDAVLVVGRVATPGSSGSALGVWYDGAYWWAYNEDGAAMGAAETFVYAEGTSLGGRAEHTAGNDYQGIGLYLDDARINGNPAATVVPQHAFGGAYNASALGVLYDSARGQWVVYNETGSALAPGQTIHYVAVP